MRADEDRQHVGAVERTAVRIGAREMGDQRALRAAAAVEHDRQVCRDNAVRRHGDKRRKPVVVDQRVQRVDVLSGEGGRDVHGTFPDDAPLTACQKCLLGFLRDLAAAEADVAEHEIIHRSQPIALACALLPDDDFGGAANRQHRRPARHMDHPRSRVRAKTPSAARCVIVCIQSSKPVDPAAQFTVTMSLELTQSSCQITYCHRDKLDAQSRSADRPALRRHR